ncbi:MAG TPA: tRNA guanosine(34) transglycosylase Tgt [Planctomycetota bacterium]|jgi:queuine tRNA-ribosyltransferase|nr:tRNA guanosine(34) transglycosylase Tgt [Planctomycetota bacterium]
MTSPFTFEVTHQTQARGPRTATFTTPHGPVQTPAFMPVGTYGSLKGLTPDQIRATGSTMILANAYHLHLRPGHETVRELGGLHRLMAWDGPILTDSGGYQVFSLGHRCRIDDAGVTVKSVLDGSEVRLEPARVMEIEAALGADVAMAFDHCPADPTNRAEVSAASERTHRWLDECVAWHRSHGGEDRGQALFGIVQGGAFEDLRRASVEAVCAHDLPGYAVGGVSVGEERDSMAAALSASVPYLPADRPRYLMGVGTPRDLFDAVALGVDLFDCVTPTRHGRNHQVFTRAGKLNLRNRCWQNSTDPIDAECPCLACRQYSRGTLRHLCKAGEMLAGTLLSIHNLTFFHGLMAKMRQAIEVGGLEQLRTTYAPAVEA